jgi:hypothetical protein
MARALGLPASASNREAVRLLISDDGGSPDGLDSALARLAGDGAAILVAGMDAAGARRAARYADDAGIPVIVLFPVTSTDATDFAFQVGTDPADGVAALRTALADKGPLVEVGPGGVSCFTAASLAGMPRFPVQTWKRDRVASLVLAGDGGCTKDALREAHAIGLKPNVGLGLESAALYPELASSRPTWVVAAGSFPLGAGLAAQADMSRWASERHRAPSWWAALGHDAAALGAVALGDFALERVDEARAVADLHRAAKKKLARVEAELWTTHARGFDGGRKLQRELGVVGSVKGSSGSP